MFSHRHTSHSGHPGRSSHSGHSNHPGRSGHPGRSSHSGHSNHPGHSGHPGRSNHPGRSSWREISNNQTTADATVISAGHGALSDEVLDFLFTTNLRVDLKRLGEDRSYSQKIQDAKSVQEVDQILKEMIRESLIPGIITYKQIIHMLRDCDDYFDLVEIALVAIKHNPIKKNNKKLDECMAKICTMALEAITRIEWCADDDVGNDIKIKLVLQLYHAAQKYVGFVESRSVQMTLYCFAQSPKHFVQGWNFFTMISRDDSFKVEAGNLETMLILLDRNQQLCLDNEKFRTVFNMMKKDNYALMSEVNFWYIFDTIFAQGVADPFSSQYSDFFMDWQTFLAKAEEHYDLPAVLTLEMLAAKKEKIIKIDFHKVSSGVVAYWLRRQLVSFAEIESQQGFLTFDIVYGRGTHNSRKPGVSTLRPIVEKIISDLQARDAIEGFASYYGGTVILTLFSQKSRAELKRKMETACIAQQAASEEQQSKKKMRMSDDQANCHDSARSNPAHGDASQHSTSQHSTSQHSTSQRHASQHSASQHSASHRYSKYSHRHHTGPLLFQRETTEITTVRHTVQKVIIKP